MKNPIKIFLVGPMGAGKTTIGRQVADHLGLEFIDLDVAIEESCGADIPWIFDREGEQGFRHRESELLNELSQRDNVVLATGGGAVLSEVNRQHLSERGVVVYLNVSINQLLDRTRHDKNRPLLQVANPRSVFEKILAERAPLYEAVADIVFTSKSHKPQLTAAQLIRQIEDFLS
jgi:shikimate kinase